MSELQVIVNGWHANVTDYERSYHLLLSFPGDDFGSNLWEVYQPNGIV